MDEAKKWSSALPLEHELSNSEYEPLNQGEPSQPYLLKYGDF